MSKVHPLIERKLELIVTGSQKAVITADKTAYPPCFEGRIQYEAWLDASDPETGSKPPPRRDWPNEPNYCRDCSPEGRNEMRKAGRCLFPDTIFITVGSGEDEEVVGISPE